MKKDLPPLDKDDRRRLTAWQNELTKAYLQVLVFLSLSESSKHVGAILEHLAVITQSQFLPAEQSLYRSLRRWQKAGLVEYKLEAGDYGPPHKRYALTDTGQQMLRLFIKRSGAILYGSKVKELMIRLI